MKLLTTPAIVFCLVSTQLGCTQEKNDGSDGEKPTANAPIASEATVESLSTVEGQAEPIASAMVERAQLIKYAVQVDPDQAVTKSAMQLLQSTVADGEVEGAEDDLGDLSGFTLHRVLSARIGLYLSQHELALDELRIDETTADALIHSLREGEKQVQIFAKELMDSRNLSIKESSQTSMEAHAALLEKTAGLVRADAAVLRTFGSRGCGVLTEAQHTCADFEALKVCLANELQTNCPAPVTEIDCTDLSVLDDGQRFRCLSKVLLPVGHPMYEDWSGQSGTALCIDPNGSIRPGGSLGEQTFSTIGIGYYHCPSPNRAPKYAIRHCKRYNSDGVIMSCGERSSPKEELYTAIDRMGDRCYMDSEETSVAGVGPCPTDNLWLGCRKFGDDNGHEGLFMYSGHYQFSARTAQSRFYRESLKCLDPKVTVGVGRSFRSISFGPYKVEGYKRPVEVGEWFPSNLSR